MPGDDMTQAEAVERARRCAVLAENILDNGADVARSRAWSAVSRAWSAVASQLPLGTYEVVLDDARTEFIPRVVEPLAAPLCYCDHGHAAGHPRTGLCR